MRKGELFMNRLTIESSMIGLYIHDNIRYFKGLKVLLFPSPTPNFLNKDARLLLKSSSIIGSTLLMQLLLYLG